MKKFALAVAALAISAASASAADLAPRYIKAPPPVVAPAYSWTGFYIGGNLGYGWGDARTDLAGNGGVITLPTIISPFDFTDSHTAHLDRVIGGGQIGYNYRFSSSWVLGFEADIQGSGVRGSNQFSDPFVFATCVGGGLGVCGLPGRPASGIALTTYQAKIDWFGTVRGRLGFLLGDQLLIYGTGGLAYGKVAISGNSSVNIPFGSMNANTAFVNSGTNVGFSVGAGVEGRFSQSLNWTWKVEYLYLDLGTLNTTASFAMSSPIFGVVSATGNVAAHTHFTDNIVRAGLNYRFGGPY